MRHLRKIASIILIVFISYGVGRLYLHITDGFLVRNIQSDFAYNPQWDTRPLAADEELFVGEILDQEFSYLGKGCQSYIFASADGNYVLKFFKYQRFKTKFWLDLFSFIPPVSHYRESRLEIKQSKLEGLFQGCRIAFDHLQPETGLVYVHLNKGDKFNKKLTIFDKVGLKHLIDIDQYEFLIQRRFDMLCPMIDSLMAGHNQVRANELVLGVVEMIVSEHERGLVDHDPALMQNTGVFLGRPVHVDVGQFYLVENPIDTSTFYQILFDKTYCFRLWLGERYPDLRTEIDKKLHAILGDSLNTLQPSPDAIYKG